MAGDETLVYNEEKTETLHKSKVLKEADAEKVPKETGFCWVVLAACIYSTMVGTSVTTTFGLMFGPKMQSMNMSNTLISWTFNLHFFIWNMDTCLSGPLSQKFGWRTVGFIAALMSALIFAIFPLVESPVVFFFLYSPVLGVSSGVSYHLTFLILPVYFQRRRGLAVCLNTAAVALSQMLVPQIIRLLTREYGSNGTILLYSGLLLNICVAASLYRPLSVQSLKTSSAVAIQLVQNVAQKNGSTYSGVNGHATAYRKSLVDQSDDVSQMAESSTLVVPSNGHVRKKSLIEELNEVPIPVLKEVQTISDVMKEIRKYFVKCIGSLRSPVVILLGFSYGLYLVGYLNFHMLIPFILSDAGYSFETASYCLSSFAVSNLIARVVNALLSDRTWFNGAFVYVSGGVLSATFCLLFMANLGSWYAILFFVICYGFGVGMTVSIFQLLVLETVGMDRYMPALGGTGIISAVMCLAVAPVLGVIRDHSSSFWHSMLVASAMQLSLSVLWLLMPLAKRYEARRGRDEAGGS